MIMVQRRSFFCAGLGLGLPCCHALPTSALDTWRCGCSACVDMWIRDAGHTSSSLPAHSASGPGPLFSGMQLSLGMRASMLPLWAAGSATSRPALLVSAICMAIAAPCRTSTWSTDCCTAAFPGEAACVSCGASVDDVKILYWLLPETASRAAAWWTGAAAAGGVPPAEASMFIAASSPRRLRIRARSMPLIAVSNEWPVCNDTTAACTLPTTAVLPLVSLPVARPLLPAAGTADGKGRAKEDMLSCRPRTIGCCGMPGWRGEVTGGEGLCSSTFSR